MPTSPLQPRDDFNPFAPPGAMDPPKSEPATNTPEFLLRRSHLRRETAFRGAGWLGLAMAALILVSFAFETAYEFHRDDRTSGLDPQDYWLARRWYLRMSAVLVAEIATLSLSYGLVRLRPWARVSLAGVGAAAILTMLVSWTRMAWLAARDGWDRDPRSRVPQAIAIGLCSTLLLVLTLSGRTRTIFSSRYREAITRTRGLGRPWNLGLLVAPLLAIAEAFLLLVLAIFPLAVLSWLQVFPDI